MYKTIFLLLIATTFACSCENSNEPKEDEVKNPREFTWTADTLFYPGSSQTEMDDIWASSPRNIYLCGHNSAFMATLWHYQGAEWNRVDLFSHIESGPHILNEIHGFPGPENYGVWVAGERVVPTDEGQLRGRKTMILYNDGQTWQEMDIKLDGRILSVHGDRFDNVWFGGDNGRVFHWDGTNWTSDVISISGFEGLEYEINKVRVFEGETFLQVRVEDDANHRITYFFMRGIIGGWEILDEMQTQIGNTTYHWGRSEIYSTDWGSIYSCHWQFYEWTNQWDLLIDESNFRSSIDDIMGSSSTSIFLVGWGGLATHWNGVNLVTISVLDDVNMTYKGVWCFKDEAFIFGYKNTGDGEKTIIYHGQ